MLRTLLDVLAPPTCLTCRAPGAGGGLCPGCRAALPWLLDPCPRCALPRPCAPCPARRAAFGAAWAPLAHAGPARDLVLALKLRGALEAVDVMAAQVVSGVPRRLLDGATLVPAPPDAGRRRRRGFDPADRLARALARRSGLEVVACLERRDGGGRQVGRGRRARRAAPRVGARGAVPRTVLLVDDVHTTGATLDACARALRAAGARDVSAVTYVRTLTST